MGGGGGAGNFKSAKQQAGTRPVKHHLNKISTPVPQKKSKGHCNHHLPAAPAKQLGNAVAAGVFTCHGGRLTVSSLASDLSSHDAFLYQQAPLPLYQILLGLLFLVFYDTNPNREQQLKIVPSTAVLKKPTVDHQDVFQLGNALAGAIVDAPLLAPHHLFPQTQTAQPEHIPRAQDQKCQHQ